MQKEVHQALNNIKKINDEQLLLGLSLEIETKLLGIRNIKAEKLSLQIEMEAKRKVRS